MGVTDFTHQFVKRYRCSSYGYSYDDCDNNWYDWGRWVVAVGIIVAILLAVFLFSCVTARRRRKRGAQPFYGTGWMAGQTPPGHNPPQYYNQPAPPYGQQPQQQNYGENSGYYAPQGGYYGQQNGVELQSPSNTYQQNMYAPPPGAPPPKN